MLAFESLLQPFGFDLSSRAKLVRHQDQRYDMRELLRSGHFEFYQSIQSADVFKGCERIISFLGQEGTHAVFVGVYEVLHGRGPVDVALPEGFPYPDMDTSKHFHYQLQLDQRFEPLRNRLIIDWGQATRSWHQHFKPGLKPVIELLPQGYVRNFPGFMEVLLGFDELTAIIKHPTPHRDWHRMLQSVAGVYLILDSATGKQYVGSAYGEGGILGRWATYADNGHGGNEQLQALLAANPAVRKGFQFSILQTLPKTLTPKEVIAVEKIQKRKLGSRAHGLNSN